jgi:hypothetical protein
MVSENRHEQANGIQGVWQRELARGRGHACSAEFCAIGHGPPAADLRHAVPQLID